MIKKTTLKWILAALGVATLVTVVLVASKKEQKPLSGYLVKKCTVYEKVSATGSLKPAKEISLSAQVAGQIKKIYFKEGDKVRSGQIIAAIDESDILARISQAKANLLSAKENLKKLENGPTEQEIAVYKAKVESAKRNLEKAKDDLKNAKALAQKTLDNLYQNVGQIVLSAYADADDAINRKLDPLFNDDSTNPKLSFLTNSFQTKNDLEWQRQAADDKLKEWKQIIDTNAASKNYSNLDFLLSASKQYLNELQEIFPLAKQALNGAINLSKADLASYKDLVNLGESEILSSLASINSQIQTISLQKVQNKQSIEAAQNAYKSAEAALNLAESELNLKTAPPRPEDIANAKANVKKAQADLNYYYNQLKKAKIIAPSDGVITKIPVEVGDFVNISQKVVGFISQGAEEIDVNIAESDIAKIKSGQEATIDFDALGPDEKFKGKVVNVNPASTVISGVVYYKVKIYLDKEDPRLKPGMTANIEILINKKENALCLPYQYFKEKNGKKYVYLERGKKITIQEIKTGLEGENNVEIIQGLKQGDKVIMEEILKEKLGEKKLLEISQQLETK